MSHLVTLSRPLPFPKMEAAGKPVTFLPVASAREVPDAALVHCITALDPMRADDIAALPAGVGLIANIGVGVDNIDLAAARARGLLVSNTPVVTEDTADLAFALILAACRRLGDGERFIRAGRWGGAGAAPALGVRVHGKTLGLIGFGAIGQAVARRAKGFGMKVIYTDPVRRGDAEVETGAQYERDIDALIEAADILSIHTALTNETRNIVNAARIARMRKGAVLVNAARGGMVDEAALCKALEEGRLAAAALDVFDGEPAVRADLRDRDDVVLTPHIGSATAECRTDMAIRALANIRQFLETRTALDLVSA